MKIAIIGCGTTGNQIIPKLREHELLIIDRDLVEEKNLSRQTQFSSDDVGRPKAQVLGEKFKINYKVLDLDCTNVNILNFDLVIDCTDNLITRFLINDYCKKENIPWIYTGVVGDRGRVLGFTGDYCFRCLFKEVKGLDTCTSTGVDLEVAGQVGKIAVEEAERILAGKKPRGLWAGEWIAVKKDKDCLACNGTYEYLDKKEDIVKFCGSSRYQFKGNFDFENIKKRLGGSGEYFVYKDFSIFKDRVLVKADSEKEAKKKFNEVIGA
tara:strand:+ start:799 stop:1599 length:801 start_codon:yes stop_codon:yes gene_type:complete